MTFQVGDSVSLKKDPRDPWLVLKVLTGNRYKIGNPHGHNKIVHADEIEPIK